MFKATWEANKGLCPPSNGNFRGYEDGLAQWVDDIIVANDTAVAQATNKIDADSQRIRQLMIEDDNATATRAYMERARVIGGSAPPSIEGGPVRGGEEAGPDSEPAQGAGDGKGGATAQQ